MIGLRVATFAAAISPLALTFAPSTVLAQDLDSFAVLGGSTVTNTGPSVITGNVGVSPGSAITGFPPGTIAGPYTFHANDGVASQAHADLQTSYTSLGGRAPTVNLTGQDLGGLVLTPGVYVFDSEAQLTGNVTLDGLGNPNAQFVFLIGTTLTTASASEVTLVNGAQGNNISYVVGSSATIGTGTIFAGEILALTSITLNTDASIICGAALAINGAVTLDSNVINVCTVTTADLGTVVGEGATTPATPAQLAVAEAIDSYVGGDGVLPPAFQDLVSFLSADALQAALGQLGGELGTAVAPAGISATSAFMSQLSDRLDDTDRLGFDDGASQPGDTAPTDDRPAPASNTVSVLGYGPLDTPARSARFGADASATRVAAPDPRLWNVWAAVHGETTDTDGDGLAGSHDRSLSTYGLSTGIDFRVTPDTRLGIAVSGGTAEFGLSDGFGSGHSDILQAALYGRTELGAAYVSGVLAVAWNDVSTARVLGFGANERLTASFSAYDVAGRVEAGYRLALPLPLGGVTSLTPYGALQVHSFHTPSYSEESALGATGFALNYDANTTTSTRTELGAKLQHSMFLDTNTILTLRSRLAWAHDDGGDTSMRAGFQSVPGSSFTTYGASDSSDSLLASAGAEIGLRNGFSLAALFDGSFSKGSQTYAATGTLSYAW